LAEGNEVQGVCCT